MKKKLIALFLLASVVFSLASCQGGDDAASTTTAATTTTASKKPAQTMAPVVTEGDDDPTSYTNLFIPHGTVTVDGVKDDAWANAVSVPLEQIKTGTPAEDTAVTASVLWDETSLYFLFEITDSDVFVGGNAGDFNNDSLYLYVSEDFETLCNGLDNFSGGVYQFALISDTLQMLPRKGVSTELQGVQSAYTLTDTGMIIEFTYTPSIIPPSAGSFILLDFQYNDSGSTGARKGALGWYNPTDSNGDPFLWGVAKLLAEGETAPEVAE